MSILKIYNNIAHYNDIFIKNYLQKNIFSSYKEIIFFQQSRLFIAIKFTLFFLIVMILFPYHVKFGEILQTGCKFFKLNEIFNFKFPSNLFFYNMSINIFLIFFIYHGYFFLINQVESIFSSLAINQRPSDSRLHLNKNYIENPLYCYVKNKLIVKEYIVFSPKDIEYGIIKQNIISKLFKIGTVIFQKHNGDQIIIRSIKYPEQAISYLTKLN